MDKREKGEIKELNKFAKEGVSKLVALENNLCNIHEIHEGVYIYDLETIVIDGELKCYAFGAVDMVQTQN